jgi:hypothetical protein
MQRAPNLVALRTPAQVGSRRNNSPEARLAAATGVEKALQIAHFHPISAEISLDGFSSKGMEIKATG